MRLRVLHTTQYRYQSPVVQAQHQAHLRPLALPGQTVLAHQLTITPEPSHQTASTDAFGNWRVFFALQEPHEQLLVSADSVVETQAASPTETIHHVPWEALREQVLYKAHTPFLPASEFVYASPFVPRSETFADLARPLFTPKRSVLEACVDLMGQLHHDLAYETASTGVNTPALEALAQGKGVCQDFAHIMIGCLRSLGLPARYVSGYLLTQPAPGQPRLIGADASHAWVSVYAGGAWHDFDPTNNRWGTDRPGEDYITLTRGRDFGDVSPLRGVIQGGNAHHLSVGVTVAPPDTFPG